MLMRVLLAEDDLDTRQFIAQSLRDLGHKVEVAAEGEQAREMALSAPFDLIILDRMMPGLNGMEVLRQLREAGVATPVLMLTALGKIEDRVDGLEAGADDYLIKPFAVSELAARVQALGRRQSQSGAVTRLAANGLEMDLLAREVRRDGEVILVQPREFRLLEELLRHAGQIVTRTMLLERVWDFHFDPQTKIVETHMSRLRGKLNEGGKPDVIETVRGSGYRIRSP